MMDDFDRYDVTAEDLASIPFLRTFPVERFAEILASGRAAVGPTRYHTREEATRVAHTVINSLKYYRKTHPDLFDREFGSRVWPSAEDGRYRWAVLPEPARRRTVRRG